MIIYLAVFLILLIGMVRYLESTSLFYPEKELAATPQAIGLDFKDVFIDTADKVKLHGWYIPKAGAKNTLLFLHGNAGNIGDRLDKITVFNEIGLNILIIDYRGYGKSAGHPTESGMYLDAQAGYDHLVDALGLKPAQIIVYGASLGGVAAVDLLTRNQAAAVILDSTFTSAAEMAGRMYPFIPSFLMKIKLDSLSKIKDVKIPKLFIHSTDDEMVPYALGKRLYNAAPEPKKFVALSGTHNDGHMFEREHFVGGIADFLNNYQLIK